MATKAYLMVNLRERFSDNGHYLNVLRDLAAMPEVESVEPVSGVCDLLVKVEAPVRVVFVANKILAKEWAKGLKILRLEPIGISEATKLSEAELVKLARS